MFESYSPPSIEKAIERDSSIEDMERLCQFARKLIEITRKEENFIDSGGAAKVYKVNDDSVCVKVIPITPIYEQKNLYGGKLSPQEEVHFLEKLSSFSHSSVRSPKFLQAIFHERKSAIIMEQLPAINLQHALLGKEDFPDSFDANEFIDDLEAYLDELHTVQDVVHGDLFARNVMIDMETGKPYIIDFGRSSHISQLSKEGQESVMRREWVEFDNICTAIKHHTINT